MIQAKIYKNAEENICGFEISNHGDPIVCSAVTMLATNMVNSIEALTDEEFLFDYDEDDWGYMKFILTDFKNGKYNHDAKLLLESFLIGLHSLEESYGKDLRIVDKHIDKEVQ